MEINSLFIKESVNSKILTNLAYFGTSLEHHFNQIISYLHIHFAKKKKSIYQFLYIFKFFEEYHAPFFSFTSTSSKKEVTQGVLIWEQR